jgi:shikimate kinase
MFVSVYGYCALDIVPVKKLILVGMSGVGKSTLAKQYAEFYSLPHYDTDRLLVNKYPAIFANSWEYFRKKESEIFNELIERDFYIISTGGGIIEYDNNIEVFEKLKEDPEVKIIKIERDVPENIQKSRVLPNSWYILNKDRFPLYNKISTDKFNNDKTPLHFISWLKQKF